MLRRFKLIITHSFCDIVNKNQCYIVFWQLNLISYKCLGEKNVIV